MKTIIFILIGSLLASLNAKSQDSLKTAGKLPYKPVMARLDLPQDQYLYAYIMTIRDSSIYFYQMGSVKHGHFQKENIYDESAWQKYHYSYLVSVKVNNHSLRSWLLPTTIVAGVLAGGLVGGSLSKNKSGIEGAEATFGSIFLGCLIGGGVGTATGLIIAGSTDKKFLINGEWKNLEQMKESLHY